VKLEMTRPHGLRVDEILLVEGREETVSSLNTGFPCRAPGGGLEKSGRGPDGKCDPVSLPFCTEGTNVNFVKPGERLRDLRADLRKGRGRRDPGVRNRSGCLGADCGLQAEGDISRVGRTEGGEILTVHFEIEGKEVKRVLFEESPRHLRRRDLGGGLPMNEGRKTKACCRGSGGKDGGTHHPCSQGTPSIELCLAVERSIIRG